MVSSQFHYTKRNRFMPFLLAEILNFQGSTHHIGVGSFSTLKEREETQGPYYSTYPSFIDSYRLVSRMAERFSFEYTLFCITLVDGKGALLEGEMVQTTSEMLKNAIGESLRKGDLFTCYSPVQYLVLLNGAGQEHVLAVCERVERSLKQWENGKKINFSHQILGLAP